MAFKPSQALLEEIGPGRLGGPCRDAYFELCVPLLRAMMDVGDLPRGFCGKIELDLYEGSIKHLYLSRVKVI